MVAEEIDGLLDGHVGLVDGLVAADAGDEAHLGLGARVPEGVEEAEGLGDGDDGVVVAVADEEEACAPPR